MMVSDEWLGTERAKRTYTLRCRDAKSCVSATVNDYLLKRKTAARRRRKILRLYKVAALTAHHRNKKLEVMTAHLYWA